MRPPLLAALAAFGLALVAAHPAAAQQVSPGTASGWYPTTTPNAWVYYAPNGAWYSYTPSAPAPTAVPAPVARVAPAGPTTLISPVRVATPVVVSRPVVAPRRSSYWGAYNTRTGAYREFGTGRPVPLHKPWLPGSPGE